MVLKKSVSVWNDGYTGNPSIPAKMNSQWYINLEWLVEQDFDVKVQQNKKQVSWYCDQK